MVAHEKFYFPIKIMDIFDCRVDLIFTVLTTMGALCTAEMLQISVLCMQKNSSYLFSRK